MVLYLLVSALVVAGLARATLRGRDSFPFSCYPMFAAAPETPEVLVVEGLDAEGRVLRLPTSALGEEKEVSRLLAEGPATLDAGLRERLRARFPVAVRLRVVRRRALLSPGACAIVETVVSQE